MKKIDILHIYAGTSGSSGLYIDAIYKALEIEFNQEVFVSYNFPFKYGKKLFYRFSDLALPNILHSSNKLRLVIRYFELLYVLFYALIYTLVYKPKIINYSLTTQINLEYFFLKLIAKLTNSKIWITAHDVIPFQTYYTDFQKLIQKRKLFFLLGDRIVVHNLNALNDLVDVYGINRSQILEYPFPIMDLKVMDNYKEPFHFKEFSHEKRKYFLFIGHFRKEKGINLLLEAWGRVSQELDFKNKKLVISGSVPKGFNLNLNKENVISINRFLTDSEYRFLIEKAECVILPYTRGTNSGIPSSVVALKTKLITSDIEMFKNNLLLDKRFLFENKNIDDLISKIKLCSELDYNFDLTVNYNKNFIKRILNIYSLEINS